MGKSIASDFSQITRIKCIFYWKQSNRSKSEWESHNYHSLFPFLSNNSHRSMFERICFFLVITCLHIVRISLRLFQMYITRTQITRSRYIDCLHRPFCVNMIFFYPYTHKCSSTRQLGKKVDSVIRLWYRAKCTAHLQRCVITHNIGIKHEWWACIAHWNSMVNINEQTNTAEYV